MGRLPNCRGYGSVCYDPRFVGGDGVMFYFHGAKERAFALVTDDQLQINAYFIGTRPHGRSRDFTWIQSLALLFRSHALSVSARRVSRWDDNTDVLVVTWDKQEIRIPTDGEAEWRRNTTSDGDAQLVSVERTDEFNSIRITVQGVVEMDVKAVPVTEEDNRVHNYQIPAGDAFAHLEAQFRFANLTAMVDGVLGRTYRPGYVSPVRGGGVPMPTMGGEDKYAVETLYAADCNTCRFRRPTAEEDGDASVGALAQF
ncbi:hypothetical protein ACLOJK_009339 [Asimina triloba]